MKILITGCGRSGTTMLLYMCQYFEDFQVITDEEYKPTCITDKKSEFYVERQKGKILVIKRPRYTKDSIYYESLKDILRLDFQIIYFIRDGRDVMVSKHPPFKDKYHIPPQRWVGTYIQDKKHFGNKNLHLIKYEDMIDNPDSVMSLISSISGKKYSSNYKDFYLNIPDDGTMKTGLGFKGPRAIQKDSIGNWRKPEHRDRMKEIIQSEYITGINSILTDMGYEKDNSWNKEIL